MRGMDDSSSAPVRRVFTEDLSLRYSDLDPLGHVNSVAYFTLLETARLGFFRTLNFVPSDAFVVARSECDYLAEIPGTTSAVTVETWVSAVGRTSVTLRQRIRSGELVHARAGAVMVRRRHRSPPSADPDRTGRVGTLS